MPPQADELLSTRAVGRLGGTLYVLSGIVTLTSPLLPAPPSMNRVGVLVVGVAAVLMGVVFLYLPWDRWPRSTSMWVAGLPAQALIGMHNHFGGSDPYRYGLFFMVCYTWVGLAQPRWSTLKLAPFTAVAYLAPLLVGQHPAWAPSSALYALPVFVLAGEATAWVSEHLRRAHESLAFQAFHDALTGLANRVELHLRTEAALSRAKRTGRMVAMLFVDLDRFKIVNDTLGHEVGDDLLRQVAVRIRETVRTEDVVSRLGGDEFAVLVEDIETAADTEHLAGRLVAALREPFDLLGSPVRVAASVGVALAPGGDGDLDSLLRNSDLAMYLAKDNGGDGVRFYETGMSEDAQARIQLDNELRLAIDRGELVPWFQPIVSLADGRIRSVEALVRWQHPERGIVAPAEFLPLAEESGLIVRIGRLVRRAACREARLWRDELGDRSPKVTVNVSARELEDDGFVEQVRVDLETAGLPGSALILEITESALLQSAVAIPILDALQDLGVGLALDDFGTGYSSLAYLKRLPVTTLKLDRSFVRDLPTDGTDAAIARTVMGLAAALGLSVTAEGVEREAQADMLADLGCDDAQGFLYARPVPAEEFTARLRSAAADRVRS